MPPEWGADVVRRGNEVRLRCRKLYFFFEKPKERGLADATGVRHPHFEKVGPGPLLQRSGGDLTPSVKNTDYFRKPCFKYLLDKGVFLRGILGVEKLTTEGKCRDLVAQLVIENGMCPSWEKVSSSQHGGKFKSELRAKGVLPKALRH